MKFTTIALASVLALSGTAAFAQPVHHRAHARIDRNAFAMSPAPYAPTSHLRPNNGNPNGNADGPTTLSGTGDSTFGGSSPGTSGYN
jgi:hypothetical protein